MEMPIRLRFSYLAKYRMATSPTYQYSAKVHKIIDADTVDFLVDLGLNTLRVIRCRLYGINAPERFTDEGKAATTYLRETLGEGKVILLTYKDPTDKYGRWIADVYVVGKSVSSMMVESGHAIRKDYT